MHGTRQIPKITVNSHATLLPYCPRHSFLLLSLTPPILRCLSPFLSPFLSASFGMSGYIYLECEAKLPHCTVVTFSCCCHSVTVHSTHPSPTHPNFDPSFKAMPGHSLKSQFAHVHLHACASEVTIPKTMPRRPGNCSMDRSGRRTRTTRSAE